MMYFNQFGLPFSFFGWFFMILFWILVFFLIFYLIKISYKNDKNSEDRSLIILKERYAKWEINEKEFDEIRKKII